MKKILLPTDFSDQAENAIHAAIDIAKKINGQIVLLHVIEQPSGSSFSVSGEAIHNQDWEDKLYILKLVQVAEKKLSQCVQTIEDAEIHASYKLRIGDTFHGIQSIISEEQAYLTVMGTQGHTVLKGLFVGSNTEKVIRHAACPVLTIKHKPTTSEYKNIVFPVPLNKDDKQTTQVMREFQRSFDAVLHLVWINTPNNFQEDSKSLEMLQQFAEEKEFQNYSLHIYNDQNVEEGILNFSEFINADLIALMTSKYFFKRVLGGGVRRSVGRHTTRPVLTWLVD